MCFSSLQMHGLPEEKPPRSSGFDLGGFLCLDACPQLSLPEWWDAGGQPVIPPRAKTPMRAGL